MTGTERALPLHLNWGVCVLQGTAVLNTVFKEYGPWAGDINTRELGSLVAFETGQVTGYAIESVQQRGRLFVGPGEEIYVEQVPARSF